jgi:hypothetical protein
MRIMGIDAGWVVVDVVLVIIVTLKFADISAAVMGVPKLPEACEMTFRQCLVINGVEKVLRLI